MRFFWFVLIIIAIFAVLSRIQAFSFNDFYNRIQGNNSPTFAIGNATLKLEVADTDAERLKGLSGRDSLGAKSGLLFVFDTEGYYGIWMKDMKFPIDIAWLDKNKRIVTIDSNVSPDTYPQVFNPDSQSLYVLETNAGFFDSHNVKIGDQADF